MSALVHPYLCGRKAVEWLVNMVISSDISVAIVIALNATEREHFAAKELKSYLERITGAKATIAVAGDVNSKTRIVVGGPSRNDAAKELITPTAFSDLFSGEEGFVIRSFGDDTILIAGCEGNCERGTIYGVYEFLERYCGCCLGAYSHPDLAAGEKIPHTKELWLNDVDYCKPKADLPIRWACVQYGDHAGNSCSELNDVFFRWLVKNRYNYIYLWTHTYETFKTMGIVDRIRSYGLEFVVGHHDVLDLFLPACGNKYFPQKYYETNPEYFRLQEDGTRFYPVDHWGQLILCCRNEEMIEEIGRNIITWLSQNPGVKVLQISAHDGTAPQCVCPKCAPYEKVENFTFFVNEIAKQVGEVFPNVKIVQMIYSDVWKCPKGVKLNQNVIVMEATWHDTLRCFGKPDGTGLIGTDFDKNIREWQKTGATAMFYEYYMGVYQNRQRYIPMADEVQAICKYYVQQGIGGAATQIECFNLWNHLFNFYTFGRTTYDTNLSMEDNLTHFINLFDEGGEYVAQAIRLAEDCVDGQVDIMSGGLYFLEHVDWKKIYCLYEQALDAAKSPVARNNLRLMRMVLRYTDLEAQQINGKYIQSGSEYESVRPFANINRELLFMTTFDSSWRNNPGYGISIPVKEDITISQKQFEPQTDRWYCFE